MDIHDSPADSAWSGVWGDAATHGHPYLEFLADHRLAGTDGCNRLIGSWNAHGNTAEFGQLASTMMFCEGVDTWLSQAASATMQGDTLTIFNEAGAPIGTLQKGLSRPRIV